MLPPPLGTDLHCREGGLWNRKQKVLHECSAFFHPFRHVLDLLLALGRIQHEVAPKFQKLYVHNLLLLSFNLLNSLGVGIDHYVQELGLPRGKLREVFSCDVEQGITERL
jgi:hypothetical protein